MKNRSNESVPVLKEGECSLTEDQGNKGYEGSAFPVLLNRKHGFTRRSLTLLTRVCFPCFRIKIGRNPRTLDSNHSVFPCCLIGLHFHS